MEKEFLRADQVYAGMVTAEPILSGTHQVVVPQNTELTSHIINLLRKWQVSLVCVWKDSARHQMNLGYSDMIGINSFEKRYYCAVHKSKEIFEYMRKNEQVPYNDFCKLADELLYELTCDKNVLAHLYRLKPDVDYTYIHAIDVGVICGLIGKCAGFGQKKIQLLILIGLMHDIGKSQIPRALLEEVALLNSEQMRAIKLHPIYGYYMVKGISSIAPEVGQAILQHHERENGGGYPRGSSSNKIHPFAKIVAIADVYDAMTSNRVYKKSVTPFEALDILSKQMVSDFDYKYCELFIDNALKTLIGVTVLLNDKSRAKVKGFDNFFSVRPVVEKMGGQLLDLHKIDKLHIEEIIKFSEIN